MQGLHQNMLLLLMLIVTGVTVYIAIEMRKRLNKADTLIHSIESVTNNIVKKEDVDALKELMEQDVKEPEDEGSEIKIVQNTPKRRRVAKSADGDA